MRTVTDDGPLLLDVNVLIALAWPQHVHHGRAHRWFDTLGSPWATTPVTESGFVRLSTNHSVVGTRVPLARALVALASIRAIPRHVFIADTTSLTNPLIALTRVVTSRQVTDAHLLNVAASAGGRLASLDKGIAEMVEPADSSRLFLLPA